MFSVYLNDLEHYLRSQRVSGITCETVNDPNYVIYLKLCILLFADDTVLFSQSKKDLQIMMNTIEQYCDNWRLTVIVSKTKVLIFSSGRHLHNNLKFYFKHEELEKVNEYKYLGVFLSHSGSYVQTKNIWSSRPTMLFFHYYGGRAH